MFGQFLKLIIVFALIAFSTFSFGADKASEEARTYFLRAKMAIEMAKTPEDFAAAAEEYKKATDVAPNMPEAWYNLGTMQAKSGQIKEAIESFNRYLALAPQAADAARIKDEVIKMTYQLERMDKFRKLNGRWVSSEGEMAIFLSEGSKLKITLQDKIYFTHSTEWRIADDLSANNDDEKNLYNYAAPIIVLEQNGAKLIGTMEIPTGLNLNGCDLPVENNKAEGTLEKGSLQLKMEKIKFKIKNTYKLFSQEMVCNEVTPVGTITHETVMMGPLENGGINAQFTIKDGHMYVKSNKDATNGLMDGDEIVSVNGVNLARFKSLGEKITKLRGKPGSTMQLAVKRTAATKINLFSKPAVTQKDISVRLVEM
jgi:hypothetical protein